MLFKREATQPRTVGNLIQCHDCRQFGYIAISGGDQIISPGWRLAWVGLKPLYICGECARKRRTEFLRTGGNGT